ncbi:MAG: sodium:solute symporter [Bacteroidales bacterium]|nr:MAG: sodium:solute symporter [Bacteroidales bacterium]
MNLSTLDLSIIIGYIILTIFIGYFLSKKASKSLSNYFLGGNKIPWYMLGVSNASGMFDITGTMWTVTILFVYGLKSLWIPWLWPVWNQIFLMMFMAVWLRRSNVMTGAEWLKTRFGDGRGSQLSHLIVVLFAIISVIGFITYGFVGVGKFAQTFFPWDLHATVLGLTIKSENMYAIIIMGLTTLYVVKGGMYSVVFTEVLQFVIMTIACIMVGVIAISLVTPEQIAAAVPEGWADISFGWNLDLDWSNLIPAVNHKIDIDGYNLFSVLMMMMIFKGILVSIAGPVPSYDMQRILSTETPKDAAKMSGIVSLVLFVPRYLMIAGLAALALVYLAPEFNKMGPNIDFEMVLPYALNNFIPDGAKGLLLAGLIAAFMSTFAANVNAGPAYIVNDIYKKFINPNASQQKYIRMSYFASFAVVIVGIFFGFFAESIDTVMKWLVGALFGGYTASNLLKWVWWRFNGYGYFYGMLAGLIASLIAPLLFPEVSPIYAFPYIFLFSFATSIIGSLLTKPESDEVLIKFYESVRPWGFWKPVYLKLQAQKPEAKPNNDFLKDMFNCTIGVGWQMMLPLIPIYFVIGKYTSLSWVVALFIITSIILYFTWYKKLEDYPADYKYCKKESKEE